MPSPGFAPHRRSRRAVEVLAIGAFAAGTLGMVALMAGVVAARVLRESLSRRSYRLCEPSRARAQGEQDEGRAER